MQFYNLNSKIGPTIEHDGKQLLYFSGTSYLGMGSNLAFEELVLRGIGLHGISHGLSRVNNVRLSLYEEFERFWAARTGAPQALVTSSGYLAGQAAVLSLAPSADYIFYAPDTHPAILPYHQSNTISGDSLKILCKEKCEQLPSKRILIIANTVDPLSPHQYDFNWIRELPPRHEYTLLLDDSHGFGVLGHQIFGTYQTWKDLPVDLVVTGSLGKGLALQAGIILGNTVVLERISQGNIYRTSSPPSPALLYAFLEGQDLYLEALVKLKKNMMLFHSLIQNNTHFNYFENYPVYAFDKRIWVKELEDKGIVVSSFPYPKPSDPWRNRIVISANHEEKEINMLYQSLIQIMKELP
jgi:8-amino-7-oxononanoate synthase